MAGCRRNATYFPADGAGNGVVNAAKLAELEAKIAKNVDNTDTGKLVIVGDQYFTILEDGTKVLQGNVIRNLAGVITHPIL